MASEATVKAGWACLIGFGALVLWVLTAVIAGAAGFHDGALVERNKAIKAGVGRWMVNETTGETRFQYRRAGQ